MNQIISAKKKILEASFRAKEGHIASAFSIMNLIYVLINNSFIFNDKRYLNNFILSKGHGCLAYYALLNEFKIISDNVFKSYCNYSSILGGHPDRNKSKYFTASTGSLGHGLPIIVGMGLADKISNKKNNYFIIMGDQECNEGTLWESLLLLNHHKINNLTIIIDRNYSREDDLNLGKLNNKLKDFSKLIYTINGHDNVQIKKTLLKNNYTEQPKIIIAKTLKGYGSKILENDLSWHHRFPSSNLELDKLKKSITK